MPKKEKQELAEEGKKTKKASAKKADKKKATEDAFDSFDAGFKDVDVDDSEESGADKALEALKKQWISPRIYKN